MKKHFALLLGSFLLLSPLHFGISSYSLSNQEKPEISKTNTELAACRFGQCQATAKSTENRCRHCVSNAGDKFCWQHK